MTWSWWPWPRHRKLAPKLLEAEVEHRRAVVHRERAEGELEDARELGDWARETTAANRFAVRLEAAIRQAAKGGPHH